MRIQHNIMAMNAYRNYNNNTKALSKNLERLSSGYKINRAGDDAAGLAISEKMRAQITGLEAAQKNVKDGISLVNTAEGAMQEIHDMLNRMVYLATQSANGTYDDPVDRLNLQKEVDSLKSEINRIADSANFNGIKLLDGEMSSFELSADGVTAGTMSIVDGLTINESTDGGGVKASASFDISSLFGTDDKLVIELSDTSLGTGGKINLAYGTDFTGDTLEEQAASIAKALNSNGDISPRFTVTNNGTNVTITAMEEGASETSVKSVKVDDKHVTFGDSTYTPGKAAATPTKMDKAGFTKLFDGGVTGGTPADSLELKAGDVLTFKFKDAQGNATLVAKVNVTEDMLGSSPADTTKNVVDALKEAKFEDITDDNAADLLGGSATGTVADESRLKVSDLFDITPNMKTTDGTTAETGSLYFKAKLDGKFDVVDVKRTNADEASRTKTVTGTAGTQAGTANVASTNTVANGSGKFTNGDTIQLSGSLSDGRNFNIKLVAGKDFQLGASYQATMNNLKAVLEKTGDGALKVTLSDGKTVDAGDIFGASKEISIATATGGITFTGVKAGPAQAGIGSAITNISFTGADAAAIDSKITKGVDSTSAESSITFGGDKPLNYGTAITIDGETYELVSDPRDVTNRSNHAVQVTDLTDTDAVAEAMAKAIKDQSEKKYADQMAEDATKYPPYTATADGSTVKITTKAKGSDVKALEITTPYGTDVPTVSFKFDPAKIQEGSYMTISNADGTNATTYEFVKAGEKAKSGNTAIEISDFNKMPDSKAIADAFANVAKGATVKVADDGTVTLTANESEGSIPALKVSFYEGKGGLKLQIGDTSDDYNQLKVSIGDMHTAAMGIDAINIGTQEGAQAAIDVIRNAINYVSGVRGDLGAISNRLDHTANNLSVMAENIQDAESTIRDTDVAEEMMAYTKNNILVQSAQAMLAQANQVPQGVLQLLQ